MPAYIALSAYGGRCHPFLFTVERARQFVDPELQSFSMGKGMMKTSIQLEPLQPPEQICI